MLIDCDAQGSLTESLGYQEPDKLDVTLSTLMQKSYEEQLIAKGKGILHHGEDVDLVPANIERSGMETALVNIMSCERVLKNNYDYVLIHCTPSLGMLTINLIVVADEVIIPVQAHYLSAKGLEQLVSTVSKVRRQINTDLKISGILLTMFDRRTRYAKDVSSVIRLNYAKYVKIYKTEIPLSIKAAETSAVGKAFLLMIKKG